MYPPPPRLPASGYDTAIANPTATAASIALPPRRKISAPASVAAALLLAIIAFGAKLALAPVAKRQLGGNVGVTRDGIDAGGASVVCAAETGGDALLVSPSARVPGSHALISAMIAAVIPAREILVIIGGSRGRSEPRCA
jgi:hypothetical protein